MPIELRAASIADLEDIRRIGIAAFTETFGPDNTEEDLAQYIAESFAPEILTAEFSAPGSSFYLMKVDDEGAGYLKLNTGDDQTEDRGDGALEVQRVYALAKFKRMGLGTAMMNLAIQRARELGLHKVWLGVWEYNAPARAFYEHLGFSVAGSHVFTVGSDDQTDLIMELRV